MTAKHAAKSARFNGLSNYHLVDPLPTSAIFDSAEMEEALMMEAQRRGANDFDLIGILKQWQAKRVTSAPRVTLGLFNPRELQLSAPTLEDGDLSRLRRYRENYMRMVRAEWQGLPEGVQKSFGYDKKRTPFDYYCFMRTVYYRKGYSDPAQSIFHRIKEDAQILGHPVSGGLHEAFVEKLTGLEQELNRWSPGLAKHVASGIASGVGGFVPRFIAPKQGEKRKTPSLSNHAFGLAIDIDSSWNPHIKDREVIDVMKDITGYDFGDDFVEQDKAIPEMDRVAQIHLRLREASENLQRWLQRYVPIYDSVEFAETPTGRKVKTKAAPANLETGPQVCEELDADTSLQMVRMQIIRKHHSIQEIRGWMRHGIQTIPLELAAAMAKLGFRWGATYEHSKDVMHFELEGAIKRDSQPRPLEELFADPLQIARYASEKRKRT